MTDRFKPDFEAFKARCPEEARSLIASARCYPDPSDKTYELFLAELGWADWMEDYTDAEDGEPADEREIAVIDGISRAAFAEAWGLAALEELMIIESGSIYDPAGPVADGSLIRGYSSKGRYYWLAPGVVIVFDDGEYVELSAAE